MWALAVAGIIFKCFAVGRFPVISTLVYVCMGWIAVVALVPLAHAITWHGVAWIAAGGIIHTLGVLFFALDRFRYFHALWHVFVLIGSAAHYAAVVLYVVPHSAS